MKEPATSSVVAATSPKQWADMDPGKAIPFWSSMRDDLIAHIPAEQRGMSAARWAVVAAKVGVQSAGFKVTLVYRFNHVLVNRAGTAGRVLAGVLNRATNLVYRSAISPRARLHGGLILPHPEGVTIGSGVVVGPRTWIFQNVTMGGTYGKEGEPRVGCDCRIYTGAVVGGPVTIGDDVVISPNSLVQRNVPSRSLAVGVPANVFPKFAKPKAE